MGKISNEAELKASIRELELKTTLQETALKENARSTARSFQPANLLKIGLVNAQKVAISRDIRSVGDFGEMLPPFRSKGYHSF